MSYCSSVPAALSARSFKVKISYAVSRFLFVCDSSNRVCGPILYEELCAKPNLSGARTFLSAAMFPGPTPPLMPSTRPQPHRLPFPPPASSLQPLSLALRQELHQLPPILHNPSAHTLSCPPWWPYAPVAVRQDFGLLRRAHRQNPLKSEAIRSKPDLSEAIRTVLFFLFEGRMDLSKEADSFSSYATKRVTRVRLEYCSASLHQPPFCISPHGFGCGG